MRIGELSRRVGVTTDTLRVWERRYGLPRPRRSAGNVRLYSAVDEARVRLMQRYINERIPPAQAAQLSLAARFRLNPGNRAVPEPADVTRAASQLRRALDEFDETAADQVLEQMLNEYSASAVMRDVILPCLHDVGERWGSGHTPVAQEHFASNFVLFRLAALSRGWDRGLGPLALLACAPGEQHTIGLVCFGIALHQHGWRIAFFGAATPVVMLEAAVTQLLPELVAVCAYVRGRLEPEAERLRELGSVRRLALAGPAASRELAAGCNAEYLDDDPISAAANIAVSRVLAH